VIKGKSPQAPGKKNEAKTTRKKNEEVANRKNYDVISRLRVSSSVGFDGQSA